MEKEKTQKLIQQIALLLQEEEKGSDDSAFLRESLEKINQRLDKIEVQLASQNPQSPFPDPKSLHPSQQKFSLIEELVDEIIFNQKIEKACTFEPNAKPCDNCSMCSSRGF